MHTYIITYLERGIEDYFEVQAANIIQSIGCFLAETSFISEQITHINRK